MRPLALLFWASLLLPSIVLGAVGFLSYRQTLDQAYVQSQNMAFILEEHAVRVFEAQAGAIESIDGRIAGLNWEEIEASEEVHRLLQTVRDRSPHVDGLWLVGPEGRTANSADFFPMPWTTVTDRDYYQALTKSDVIHLGEIIQGRLKGTLNFNLSRRRTSPDGGFDGLILVTISLDYFEHFWRQVLGNAAHTVSLFRADGKVLARSPALTTLPRSLPPGSPFFSLTATQDSGTYALRSSFDGQERIISFSKLGNLPAYIAVGLDRATMLGPWKRQVATMAVVAVAITLLLLAAVRTVQRRHERLLDEIARRRQAESTLIALDEHVAALERADAELRDSEERFRSLFETLTQGAVLLDAAGHVTGANTAAEEILGLTVAEMQERSANDPRWQVVDADGKPFCDECYPAVRALKTGKVVRGVLMGVRNPARDERRWIIVDAIPQKRPGEDRPYGGFTLFSDVTEQKKAEEAQRLLVREVDHRAKNALAVVQALLRLTKADSREEYIEAVEGRVAAMARAHTLLAKSRWKGADLAALVEEELAPYLPAEGAHVHLEGPPLLLHAEATQGVAMVLHELATNAAKYGGLSTAEGRLSVTWTLDSPGKILELRWVESGGPPVNPPATRGFGSTLIQSTVKGQLDGEIRKEWLPEGMRATIRLPSGHVAAMEARKATRAMTPAAASADLTGLRVLLAEDNTLVSLEVTRALAQLGCVVVGPATTLKDAARLVASETVDVAILDVDLRGKKVFPVAGLLASHDVPLIFCTGFTSIDPLEKGAWVDAPVIHKPFSREQIAAALAGVVSRRQVAV